jgi:hypothetical protein
MLMTKPTIDRTKFKYSEYSCIQICNVDDAKVIKSALILDRSKPVNMNEHRNKTEKSKQTPHQDETHKITPQQNDDQHNVALRRRNHKEKGNKICVKSLI